MIYVITSYSIHYTKLYDTNDEYQLSELEDIDPKISGKTVSNIKSKNKTIYDRVENLTIPITVLRCDYET